MSDKLKHIALLENKLSHQKEVYEDFKNNRCPSVCYKCHEDDKWGVSDENYTNRLRLAYYMFYEKIDDEDVVIALFEEELKDRETNSFQGIGDSLEILTQLLKKYNLNGKYNSFFKKAEEANFDCYCGYIVDKVLDDNIESNDLLDCIYLTEVMDYMDIMEELVEQWKQTQKEWNKNNRKELIRFNSVLNKKNENEEIYKQLLLSADKENTYEMILAYSGIIGYYIEVKEYKSAYNYFKQFINENYPDGFNAVLEYGLDIAVNEPEFRAELWSRIKPELQKRESLYGNLYKKAIAAAKFLNDPYSEQLEKEYIDWMKAGEIK